MQILDVVTFEQVKNSPGTEIWYSARTCWWTDDPDDLQPGPVPMDIFSCPLFIGNKAEFLDMVERKPDHYGVHGVETFMAMHHKNFRPEVGESPGAFTGVRFFDYAVTRHKDLQKRALLLKDGHTTEEVEKGLEEAKKLLETGQSKAAALKLQKLFYLFRPGKVISQAVGLLEPLALGGLVRRIVSDSPQAGPEREDDANPDEVVK